MIKSHCIPTGADSIASPTAKTITIKLIAIKNKPIANFIGKDGSMFLLAKLAHMPAKIGAKVTTNMGFANCNHPIGMM